MMETPNGGKKTENSMGTENWMHTGFIGIEMHMQAL